MRKISRSMRVSHKFFLAIALLSLIWICPEAQGRSLFVSQSGDGQGGSSWETAFRSIQTAIDNSSSDDEIYVSNESYDERVLVAKDLIFHGGSIIGSTGESLATHQVGSTYTRIVYSGYPLTAFVCNAKCQLYGFRISPTKTNGLSINLGNAVIEDSIIENGLGGIFINEGNADLNLVTIANNSASGSFGGILIENSSNVTLKDCEISGNASYRGGGGGIVCSKSTVTMDKCIITNNHGYSQDTVEPWSIGAGMYIGNPCTVIMRNCLIANNSANEFRQVYIEGYYPVNVSHG